MICIENVSKDYFSFIFNIFLNRMCKKEEVKFKPPDENKSYEIYNEALNALNGGEYFLAAQKFSEAEKILPIVDQSAKALLMSSYCFYSINFYDDAISSLENF